MSIFQKSVINKHLSNLDNEVVEKTYQKFRENYNSSKIAKIRELKEEEYQDGFLRDMFVDVFGYILKPDDNYNLVLEFKNQGDSKKADGAILKDGKVVAVIEFKSSKTKDLKSVTEQVKWEEFFNNYKTESNNLQSEIDKTDKEIDKMVYELYGLTEEEIKIVENKKKNNEKK